MLLYKVYLCSFVHSFMSLVVIRSIGIIFSLFGLQVVPLRICPLFHKGRTIHFVDTVPSLVSISVVVPT